MPRHPRSSSAAGRPTGLVVPQAGSLRLTRVRTRVRFYETDMMGVVHHANYLRYFELGRVEWLRARSLSYEGWVRQGVHLPVVDARARYLKPARFDDELAIDTFVSELSGVTVRFAYRVYRGEGVELLCEGDTLLACVGDDLRPRRFPDFVGDILREALVDPVEGTA
jgi:acyl-CoA thioester hydrolase